MHNDVGVDLFNDVPVTTTTTGINVSFTLTLMRRNVLALLVSLLILWVFDANAEKIIAIPNDNSQTVAVQALDMPSKESVDKSITIGIIMDSKIQTNKVM